MAGPYRFVSVEAVPSNVAIEPMPVVEPVAPEYHLYCSQPVLADTEALTTPRSLYVFPALSVKTPEASTLMSEPADAWRDERGMTVFAESEVDAVEVATM
jgi:hypothetical protein